MPNMPPDTKRKSVIFKVAKIFEIIAQNPGIGDNQIKRIFKDSGTGVSVAHYLREMINAGLIENRYKHSTNQKFSQYYIKLHKEKTPLEDEGVESSIAMKLKSY